MCADFHNDFLTDDNACNILKEYNLNNNLITCAIFRGNRNFSWVLERAKWFISNKNDNLYLAFEDIGYESLNQIEKLLNFNPVYCTLTWNGENNLGCGAGKRGGLKQMGFDAIKLLNERNIAVDTAHTNCRSFYEIVESAERVINSHCCFYNINPHMRNITDEQIKYIIGKKGLIGLALYSPFLTSEKQATIETVFTHIDHFVQKFGWQNLCIGSDFYGATDFPEQLDCYEKMQNIKAILLNHGYEARAVSAILSTNIADYVSSK